MSTDTTNGAAPGADAAPETVTLTIDGREVTVPKGTNVLEVARGIGIEISHFCYHPGLSIAACCRQCLVTVENMPKLQPSCQIEAKNQMVVRVADPDSTLARKQMLEFTLVNHPIDCPICDKAGECTLQQLYFDHDNAPSRVDVPKVRKPKVVDLGPHIVLDAERCILCTRCIRVCDEVAGVHQLEMHYRGDHQELSCAPGERLDNPYSINTVDVCPVGALTAKDFRFTMRAWELLMTPSVCNGCATGCNIEIHHRNERAWRLVPRHNPDVNDYWMCDEGRLTYHELRETRLTGPVVDGMPARWDAAVAEAGKLLTAAIEADPGKVGVVLSPAHTNEDNYVLHKLAREFWQAGKIFLGGEAPVPERADDILRDADVNANTAGVRAIAGGPAGDAGDGVGDVAALEAALEAGELSALVFLGHEHALSVQAISAIRRLGKVVAIAARETEVVSLAAVALPVAMWAEVHGTITNRSGRVQRMHAAFDPPGQAIPGWGAITRLAVATGAAMSYDDPRAIFTEMTGAIAAFAGAAWGKPAPLVQLRFAHSRG